jgi:hypothetical protein
VRSLESISGGVEEVAALLWFEEVSDVCDGLPEFIDGSGGPGTQVALSLETAISIGFRSGL